MPTQTLSLSKLAQQLAQKQSELVSLQRNFDSRLSDLLSRKQELETALRQVDAEIKAAKGGSTSTTTKVAKPAAVKEQASLTSVILAIVQEKGKPLTTKQITDELQVRAFQSNSANFPKLVSNKVLELVNKKVLSRSKGGKGVVLGSAQLGKRGKPQTRKATPKPPPAAKVSTCNGVAAPANQVTLPTLLTNLLAKSTEPLKASELAKQALAAGYKTTSKEPVNLVWSALGKMENVENVKGKGYRLKK